MKRNFDRDSKIYWTIALSFVLLGVFSCAPRDNPYDLNSPYALPLLKGRVMDIWGREPVANARVEIDSSFLAFTDENGEFEVRVDVGEHIVSVYKDGYLSDSEQISLKFGDVREVEFRLDALPYMDSARLVTDHILSNISGESYILKARCKVLDPDGLYEIDSVIFELPDTFFIMERDGEAWFSLQVDSDELPSGSIHSLIGRSLFFKAVDVHGAHSRFGPFTLTRIIEPTPSGVSPIGGASVSPQPEIVWRCFGANFPVSYELELYSAPIGQPPTLVLDTAGLTDTVYTIQSPLDEGYYYWVVYAVDEFGNRSRSVEYLFRVVP